MLARRQPNLTALEAEIPNSKGFCCDVSVAAEATAALATVEAALGPIDVLIFNASFGPFKPVLATTQVTSCFEVVVGTHDSLISERSTFHAQEEYELSLRTGPAGLFACAKHVVPGMVARKRGVIGVTGATASWRGMPNTAAKASANAAMRMLSQSLARDLGPRELGMELPSLTQMLSETPLHRCVAVHKEGVHVFHIVIDGIIDQPRTHSWMPDKPANEFMDPARIAEVYWHMANQPASCWGFEMNIMAGMCTGSMATV